MPKYRVMSDMDRVCVNPKKEKLHPELLSKTVEMMIVDKMGDIAARPAKIYKRRQSFEVSLKTILNADLHHEVIQIERVYRKICESERKDIELITAGLSRFKR